MKRLLVAAVVIGIAAVAGLVSNAYSIHEVERQVQRGCVANMTEAARLWGLAVPRPAQLPASAIRIRSEVGRDGAGLAFQVPPASNPPYMYAHAKQIAPFIFRVQYGWALAGAHITLGQGGNQLILSVFRHSKVLRDRREWQL
jgi:type II secretory pathway pseudopilin PulG